MQSQDEMVAQMAAVRDQVIEILAAHEREVHGGKPCLSNRASALGYLAHALGVRSEAWRLAEQMLREYDANCTATDCMHGLSPVQDQREMWNSLREADRVMEAGLLKAMDLSTWSESHGAGCVDAIVCPHCGHRTPAVPNPAAWHYAVVTCDACHRSYELRVTDTPLGLAFLTNTPLAPRKGAVHGQA